jgi:hypothetical protein
MYFSSIKTVFSFRTLLAKAVCIAALVLAGNAPQAQAALYVDYDEIVKTLSESNPTHYGSFDILSQGYNPDAEQVTWAAIAFTFLDSDSNEDTVRISLNGDSQGVHLVTYGFSAFGGLLSGDALFDLNAFGILSYQVRWLSGDPFQLKSATLLAETSANASVPDGGTTVGMLGLALLGLGFVSRRLTAPRA